MRKILIVKRVNCDIKRNTQKILTVEQVSIMYAALQDTLVFMNIAVQV